MNGNSDVKINPFIITTWNSRYAIHIKCTRIFDKTLHDEIAHTHNTMYEYIKQPLYIMYKRAQTNYVIAKINNHGASLKYHFIRQNETELIDALLFSGVIATVSMWTYSSVDIPGPHVSRTERVKIYLSECIVCFCIVFFILCVGLLLYLFFHLYSTVTTAGKLAGTLAES